VPFGQTEHVDQLHAVTVGRRVPVPFVESLGASSPPCTLAGHRTRALTMAAFVLSRPSQPQIATQLTLTPHQCHNIYGETMGTYAACREAKNPPKRVCLRADDGTRTHDLLHGKQTL
jgi:hypothetical protein